MPRVQDDRLDGLGHAEPEKKKPTIDKAWLANRLQTADVALDWRRVRRSLSPAEVERIAEAAEQAVERPELHLGRTENRNGTAKGTRPAQRLSAVDRGLLWRFLAGTGLRVNEARFLTVGDRPGITLPARITKGKRADYVPLAAELAERLRRGAAGGRSRLLHPRRSPETVQGGLQARGDSLGGRSRQAG